MGQWFWFKTTGMVIAAMGFFKKVQGNVQWNNEPCCCRFQCKSEVFRQAGHCASIGK